MNLFIWILWFQSTHLQSLSFSRPVFIGHVTKMALIANIVIKKAKLKPWYRCYSWCRSHLLHPERPFLTTCRQHWQPGRCNLQHQHEGSLWWLVSLSTHLHPEGMMNAAWYHLEFTVNANKVNTRLCNFFVSFNVNLTVLNWSVSTFFLLFKGLPLYHQISGLGTPDAEQVMTVVSPVPVRIWLSATLTTGDSRLGEIQQIPWSIISATYVEMSYFVWLWDVQMWLVYLSYELSNITVWKSD